MFSLYTYRDNCPTPGGHVFLPIITIFHLVREIYKIDENAPPPGGYDFLPIRTIFQLNRHIQKTHVLTKCHADWTEHVTSRVFTCFHYIHIEKSAPPRGGHVFSPICTIFERVRDINKTNVLIKFHDDWAQIVTSRVFTRSTAPAPGGHIFKGTGTIFELN
ncbi:hypothetical protein DPMN_049926 [Dreissena polymorpha]|uniref:Uncharacterized protein n=1 Tax=Dreissena polymorpha TaxID=45954 RepID=A0A9D4HLR9_DREPO|nr:hypothetical protein DPMN_049926 [Dreissena polymorpha]